MHSLMKGKVGIKFPTDLLYAECGANYRRITCASREVVWRCANRVERRSCTQSPSIAEQDIIQLICNELDMDTFDSEHVRDSLDQILIDHVGSISFEHKHTQRFSIF